jgi:hypothetical protein
LFAVWRSRLDASFGRYILALIREHHHDVSSLLKSTICGAPNGDNPGCTKPLRAALSFASVGHFPTQTKRFLSGLLCEFVNKATGFSKHFRKSQ